MHVDVPRDQELLPLTDSLSSRIRWRFCDYEAMLRAQVELMLDNDDYEREFARRVQPRQRQDR